MGDLWENFEQLSEPAYFLFDHDSGRDDKPEGLTAECRSYQSKIKTASHSPAVSMLRIGAQIYPHRYAPSVQESIFLSPRVLDQEYIGRCGAGHRRKGYFHLLGLIILSSLPV